MREVYGLWFRVHGQWSMINGEGYLDDAELDGLAEGLVEVLEPLDRRLAVLILLRFGGQLLGCRVQVSGFRFHLPAPAFESRYGV